MRSWTMRSLDTGRATAMMLTVAAALLFASGATANASPPVLEFATPGKAFPVAFTTESGAVKAELDGFDSVVHCAASHGEGQITGPRSTVSRYSFSGCVTEGATQAKCQSAGAKEEEIVSEEVNAELVYIDQARHEVGILLDPAGGIYMTFECGGESVEARGPFLSSVSPIDKETTSFTATLSESQGVQTPDEYEDENGEKHLALPTGKRGTHEPAPTGVEAAIAVHTSVPLTIAAVTTADMEAKQREEGEKARQAETRRMEETIAKLREEAAADKLREESLSAQIAAILKRQEEEAEKAKHKHPTRAQLLAQALKRCRRGPARRRALCEAKAKRRYGASRKGKRK